MKKGFSILFCLIICVFASFSVYAKNETSAYGRVNVTDFSINKLPGSSYGMPTLIGAAVTMTGSLTYSAAVDLDGYFEFKNILPGEYYLTTKVAGFQNITIGPIVIEEGVRNEIIDIPLGSLSFMLFGLNREGKAHFAETSLNYLNFYFTVGNRMRNESNKMYNQDYTKSEFRDYLLLKSNQLSMSDVLVLFYYGGTFVDPESGMVYLDCADAKFDKDTPLYDTLISSAELTSWLNEGLSEFTRVILFMESENSFEFCRQLFTGLEFPLACVAAAYGNNWFELAGPDLGFMTYCIGGILNELGPNSSQTTMNLAQLVSLTSYVMSSFEDDMQQEITFIHSNDFTTGIMLYSFYLKLHP